MNHDAARAKPLAPRLLAGVALVGLATVSCSEIQSEPNVEQGGLLEEPTQEQDTLDRVQERQRQNRGGGGGGSY
jgi:hypothetical protein